MNKKILLGLTLAAVLTLGITSPAIADAMDPVPVPTIKKTDVKVKNGEIDKVKFHLDDKVPKAVFGGYAIFTEDGAVVAFTSHPTVYDSVAQTAPTADQIGLEIGAIAAGCSVSPDIACGGEWHSHLVVPDTNNQYCSFAAISELTFNEPADKVKAKGKHVEGKDIAMGTGGFVGAISGVLQDFTVGAPVDADDTTEKFDGASFDLNPAFDAGVLSAICIGDTTGYEAPTETESLCAELGSTTGGTAFRDTYDQGELFGNGDILRLEVTEFPYGNDLWTDANINQGSQLGIEGVGPGELDAWYSANCVAP